LILLHSRDQGRQPAPRSSLQIRPIHVCA